MTGHLPLNGVRVIDFGQLTAGANTSAMLADLASWQGNDAANFGWALVSDETQTPPTAKRLESAEATDPATRPLLVIDYHLAPRTPIPALGMLATLLLALGVWSATRWTASRR